MLEYRIFDYGKDEHYIGDIVDAISQKDNCSESLSVDWFRCRFEDNPIGEAIIIIAIDKERLAAFVAVERFPICISGLSFIGGYVHYYYVHQKYEGQDVLSNMLFLVASEAKKQDVQVIVTQSMLEDKTNAKVLDWSCATAKINYRLHSVDGWKSLFRLLDCTRPFVSYSEAKQSSLQRKAYDKGRREITVVDKINGKRNFELAYYQWVTSVCLSGEMAVLEEEDVSCAIILGHRGKRARVAHIVYMSSSNVSRVSEENVSRLINDICRKYNVNVISCLNGHQYVPSDNSLLRSQQINYCYKWLDAPVKVEIEQMVSNVILLFG